MAAKEECKALLDALSKVTACYRHLVLTVGGASDSQNLREELRQTRRKAQELAAAARDRLTAALRDKTASKEERAELERLWVLFSTCLELLEADMRRALELGREFPLQVPRRPLIQSGLSGGTSAVAARALGAQQVQYQVRGGGDVDAEDLKELENELNQVGEMCHEMEMKVSVPQWTVEAKQDPGAELHSAASAGAVSSLGPLVAAEEPKAFCDVGRILAGIIFTAVLLVAVILAVCVAKLS